MNTEKVIGNSTGAIINRLYGQLDYSAGRAKLARLRNSLGQAEPIDTYPFLFEMIPEELLGRSKMLSDEEKAVVWSLQFYALLQQGRDDCVHRKSENHQNLGSSLSKLRVGDESGSVDRRFNAMILADTAEEFQVHLRHMIRLYKSKIKNGSIDFVRLSMDIYQFIHWENGKEQIRLVWSREYYKISRKEEDYNEEY